MHNPMSPAEVQELYRAKRKVIGHLFLTLPITLALIAIVVWPPEHIKILFLSPPKAEVLKMSEAHKALLTERDGLRKQLESLSALNETLRKKASTVTLSDKAVTPPAILTRYMSWVEFQKANPGADFKAYRERQVEFLHGEIDKANAFFLTLND